MDESQTFDGQSLASRLAQEWQDLTEIEEFTDEELQTPEVKSENSTPPLETVEPESVDGMPDVPQESPIGEAEVQDVEQTGELDANQSADMDASGSELPTVPVEASDPLELSAESELERMADQPAAEVSTVEGEVSEQSPLQLETPAESVDTPVAELDPAGGEPEQLQPAEQPAATEPSRELAASTVDVPEEADAGMSLPNPASDLGELDVAGIDSETQQGDMSVPGEVGSDVGPEVEIVSRDLPESSGSPLPIRTADAANDPGLEMADEPTGWLTDFEPSLAAAADPSSRLRQDRQETQPIVIQQNIPNDFAESISQALTPQYKELEQTVTSRLMETISDQNVMASLGSIPE